jgi:hypothetical protein
MTILKKLKRALVIQVVFLLSLCFMWATESHAVTKEQAIQIASKEIRKLDKVGYVFKKWEITFDEGNLEWEKVRAFRKTSPILEARQYFEKQEAKLWGKEFVAIRFRYDRTPGREVKDGVAWVFIEKETAKILLVIKPG